LRQCGRCTAMRHSCVGVLAFLLLLVAVIVFALTPPERRSASSSALPGPLWGARP